MAAFFQQIIHVCQAEQARIIAVGIKIWKQFIHQEVPADILQLFELKTNTAIETTGSLG